MHTASRLRRTSYFSEKLLMKRDFMKEFSLVRKGQVFDTVVSGWIIGDPLSGLNSQIRSPSTGWMLYPVQRKKW